MKIELIRKIIQEAIFTGIIFFAMAGVAHGLDNSKKIVLNADLRGTKADLRGCIIGISATICVKSARICV
jgi:hypothetical protein